MILDDDDNDEFEEGDELVPTHISGSPPALPPKRNMRKPISHSKPSQQGESPRCEWDQAHHLLQTHHYHRHLESKETI